MSLFVIALGGGGWRQTPPVQPPAQVPESNRLTLDKALDIGLHHNPQIAASLFAVESARQNYDSQKAPLNPTVAYGALNNTVAPLQWGSGFSQPTNYSAYATLETNGAERYRAWQSREQWHQSQFDAATAGLSLKLGILNAYVGLQVANRALEIELKVYDNVHKLTELTRRRFETGAGPEADLTRAQIAEIQEQQNVIADVAGVNGARATLSQQLGLPQSQPVDAAEPLVYKRLDFPDIGVLLKQSEDRRPELKSAQANLDSLRAVPGLQRSAYFPNVTLATDFSLDAVFIGLSMPIDLGGIRGAVNKAKADVKSQQAQVEVQRQGIDADVQSSYVAFQSAQKNIDTYDTGILKKSEILLDEVRHGYELGANTIVDILTAENTYRSVETAYYSTVGTYYQAAYTLKHAIGDLPDHAPFAVVENGKAKS